MTESTRLSRTLTDQGVRLRLRKEPRAAAAVKRDWDTMQSSSAMALQSSQDQFDDQRSVSADAMRNSSNASELQQYTTAVVNQEPPQHADPYTWSEDASGRSPSGPRGLETGQIFVNTLQNSTDSSEWQRYLAQSAGGIDHTYDDGADRFVSSYGGRGDKIARTTGLDTSGATVTSGLTAGLQTQGFPSTSYVSYAPNYLAPSEDLGIAQVADQTSYATLSGQVFDAGNMGFDPSISPAQSTLLGGAISSLQRPPQQYPPHTSSTMSTGAMDTLVDPAALGNHTYNEHPGAGQRVDSHNVDMFEYKLDGTGIQWSQKAYN